MISLPWPPTVNHYYRAVNGRNILSAKGRAYKKEAGWEIIAQGEHEKYLEGDVSLFIRAYPPDKRRRDLDNILKPILDVLADCDVFDDDSQVSDLRIQRFNPCKPGRVEILVYGGEGK